MQFLRSIAAVFRTAFSFLGSVAMTPFRVVGNVLERLVGGGGGMPELPDLSELREPRAPAPDPKGDAYIAEHEAQMERGRLMANALMGYCADSVVDDCPAELPNQLSPELKSWARGLSRDECVAIMSADERTVHAHIAGLFHMPDVRRVTSLPPATWGSKPPADDAANDLDFSSGYAPMPG